MPSISNNNMREFRNILWVGFFVALFTPITSYSEFIDVGFKNLELTDYNFYGTSTEFGKVIKSAYLKNAHLKDAQPMFNNLPEDFEPIVDKVHDYVLDKSMQKINKRKWYSAEFGEIDMYSFYSGRNGLRNGEGFTFNRGELPTKIVRMSFCFGFDPMVYTGLLRQESMFSVNAESPTGAFGLSQLTSSAIAEVSEQLGVLGGLLQTPGLRAWLLHSISCYLGPNKKWVNIWEGSGIPYGKKAYKNQFIGEGRKWLYLSKTRKWFNEDEDRNLIYGAIYFKLMLSREDIGGKYSLALESYNVGQAQVYKRKIQEFYNQLISKVGFQDVESKKSKSKRVLNSSDYITYDFEFKNEYCKVPIEDTSLDMREFLSGIYSTQETLEILRHDWLNQGFCKKKKRWM